MGKVHQWKTLPKFELAERLLNLGMPQPPPPPFEALPYTFTPLGGFFFSLWLGIFPSYE